MPEVPPQVSPPGGSIVTARAPPLFAELRRLTTLWAQTTATLLPSIPLQATSEPSVVTVGREGNNHTNLDCGSIQCLLSRKHSKIMFDPVTGAHTVQDLDSTNGTYLNGNLLPGPHLLQHGDIISFGGPAAVSSQPPPPPSKKNPSPDPHLFQAQKKYTPFFNREP